MTDPHLTKALRALALAALVTIGSAAPALAAPKSTTSPPFTPFESWNDTCQAGATCTASASATGEGQQVVSSSVSRPEVTELNEYSQAWATGSVSTRAPEGTEPLRVTFTWRVDSATTSANSTTVGGTAVGRIFADGAVTGCTSCVVEGDTEGKDVMVASTFSNFGPVPPEKITPAGSLVTHTVTVNGRDRAPLRAGTRMTLAGHTRAFSYVGGVCDGTCATAPHSGSASAEARLQLVSITMARGSAPDQPVLLDI